MEDAVVRGVRWTLLGFALNRALGILTTLVVARLLVPQDFGAIAFASVVIGVIRYLVTLGVGPAVVVRQDLSRQALGSALTLLVSTHIAAVVLIVAVSPAAGSMLGQRRATAIIVALACPLLFGGARVFYEALLQRELVFGRQFAANTVQAIVVAVVSVGLAALHAGVWSLVAGQVMGEMALTVMLIVYAPFHVRPQWDPGVVRSLWRSGRGFMLQGTFSFAEQNLDYFVVGGTLGAKPLGVYGLGYRISELPYNAIVDPIAQTTFPGFARVDSRGDDPTDTFLACLGLISFCAFPLGVLLAGAAGPFVDTVLGSRWSALTAVLPILALWGSVRTVQGTIGWFLNSLGYAERLGLSYGVMLLGTTPILVAAAHFFGLRGVAGAMLLNVLIMLAIGARIVSSSVGVTLARQRAAIRPSVLSSVPAGATTAALSTYFAGRPPALVLVSSTAVGLAVYLAVVSRLRPGLLRHAGVQLARIARSASVTPAHGPTDAGSSPPPTAS